MSRSVGKVKIRHNFNPKLYYLLNSREGAWILSTFKAPRKFVLCFFLEKFHIAGSCFEQNSWTINNLFIRIFKSAKPLGSSLRSNLS